MSKEKEIAEIFFTGYSGVNNYIGLTKMETAEKAFRLGYMKALETVKKIKKHSCDEHFKDVNGTWTCAICGNS